MTSKQLEKRMETVWDKITVAYYESQDPQNNISKLERLQIQALMWHAKQVCETLKELPF